MPHRIVVATIVVLAALAAPAFAQDPSQTGPPAPAAPVTAANGVQVSTPAGHLATGPRVTASLRVASAFWEARPHGCARGIQIYDAILPDEFGGLTIPAIPCAMWIGHGFFTGHAADDRVGTCDQIVRQYGRLVGARRSLHPRSIMNEATSATVWGCNRRFLPRIPRGHHRSPVVWATR